MLNDDHQHSNRRNELSIHVLVHLLYDYVDRNIFLMNQNSLQLMMTMIMVLNVCMAYDDDVAMLVRMNRI